MSQTSSPESHRDEVDAKLIRLRKATMAVEKLLYGELVNSPLQVMVEPDWKSLKLPLAKLTMIYEFNCVELARILTARAKLLPTSKPVQNAARWLLGVENNLPANFQDPAYLAEIQRAADFGNVNFFMELGEHLRYLRKNSGKRKTEDSTFDLKWTLATWWHPNPRLKWPGLAYCKPSARWDFFRILHPHTLDRGKNYLDTMASRLGLLTSVEKNRFVSCIKVKDVKTGLVSFS
jgi:hypothetical protein